MKITLMMALVFSLLFLTYINCGVNDVGVENKKAEELQATQSETIFSDNLSEFKIKIYYEVGAEPYTDNIGLTANKAWDITEESYISLFSSHQNRTITVPKSLEGMVELPDKGKSTWTSSELISLGKELAKDFQVENSISIALILLNGKYDNKDTILGVQFTGHPFAFVFKDIVKSVGGTPTDQIYVEQATIVHEVGHAVGFVNNGIPMVIEHEDKEHTHHTMDKGCVMYWAVESTTGILEFLTGIVSGTKLNLFGEKSLNDGREFHP